MRSRYIWGERDREAYQEVTRPKYGCQPDDILTALAELKLNTERRESRCWSVENRSNVAPTWCDVAGKMFCSRSLFTTKSPSWPWLLAVCWADRVAVSRKDGTINVGYIRGIFESGWPIFNSYSPILVGIAQSVVSKRGVSPVHAMFSRHSVFSFSNTSIYLKLYTPPNRSCYLHSLSCDFTSAPTLAVFRKLLISYLFSRSFHFLHFSVLYIVFIGLAVLYFRPL